MLCLIPGVCGREWGAQAGSLGFPPPERLIIISSQLPLRKCVHVDPGQDPGGGGRASGSISICSHDAREILKVALRHILSYISNTDPGGL